MTAGQVVVIVTNGRDPADVIEAVRASWQTVEPETISALIWTPAPPADDETRFGPVLWLGGQQASAVERLADGLTPPALTRVLMRSGAGRLVHSLLPGDLGRRVWRRARRVPEAMTLLRDARLVVAADPGGVRTAWFARHRLGAERAIIAGQP